MNKEFNYIGLYQKMFNITWDKSFYHIHHIDGNHDNNDYQNLVLLPKSLHLRFHMLQTETKTFAEEVLKLHDLDRSDPEGKRTNECSKLFPALKNFLEAKKEVEQFMYIKNAYITLLMEPNCKDDHQLLMDYMFPGYVVTFGLCGYTPDTLALEKNPYFKMFEILYPDLIEKYSMDKHIIETRG